MPRAIAPALRIARERKRRAPGWSARRAGAGGPGSRRRGRPPCPRGGPSPAKARASAAQQTARGGIRPRLSSSRRARPSGPWSANPAARGRTTGRASPAGEPRETGCGARRPASGRRRPPPGAPCPSGRQNSHGAHLLGGPAQISDLPLGEPVMVSGRSAPASVHPAAPRSPKNRSGRAIPAAANTGPGATPARRLRRPFPLPGKDSRATDGAVQTEGVCHVESGGGLSRVIGSPDATSTASAAAAAAMPREGVQAAPGADSRGRRGHIQQVHVARQPEVLEAVIDQVHGAAEPVLGKVSRGKWVGADEDRRLRNRPCEHERLVADSATPASTDDPSLTTTTPSRGRARAYPRLRTAGRSPMPTSRRARAATAASGRCRRHSGCRR